MLDVSCSPNLYQPQHCVYVSHNKHPSVQFFSHTQHVVLLERHKLVCSVAYCSSLQFSPNKLILELERHQRQMALSRSNSLADGLDDSLVSNLANHTVSIVKTA